MLGDFAPVKTSTIEENRFKMRDRTFSIQHVSACHVAQMGKGLRRTPVHASLSITYLSALVKFDGSVPLNLREAMLAVHPAHGARF